MSLDQAQSLRQAGRAGRGDLHALEALLRALVNHIDQLSDTELGFIDAVTAGTGAASKALVLDASGNVAMPDNGILGLSRGSVAAAGTTAADATVLADQINAVTASDGAKGVALPAAATTTGPILVINTAQTANLLVYPVNGGNDQINGGAEDAAFTIGAGKAAWFIPTSATQWYADSRAGPDTVSATAATLAVTSEAHNSKTILLNKADGLTVTLPAATGSGARFEFVVGTSASGGNYVIQVADATDIMDGIVYAADDTATPAPLVWVTAADSDTVTLNGGSQGGLIGDRIILQDLAANQWSVQGFVKQSGTEATPFSAAVA